MDSGSGDTNDPLITRINISNTQTDNAKCIADTDNVWVMFGALDAGDLSVANETQFLGES